MLQNINIPLDSPLDLASYDTTVPKNEVSFSDKETLVYRNCLSNLRKTNKNGLITTAGANLHVDETDGRLKYNDIDLGIKTANTSHRFLTKRKELPKNFPGEYYGAYLNEEISSLVIFSEDNAQYYTSYYDKETFELLSTTVYNKDTPNVNKFALPVRANHKISPQDTAPARHYHLELTWTNNESLKACVITCERVDNTIKEIKSNEDTIVFDKISNMFGIEMPTFTFMGEKKDAMTFNRADAKDPFKPEGTMLEAVSVAFDDIDQRKRGTFNFGVYTQPDGTVSFTRNQYFPYIQYFGTFGTDVNGKPILTGEPLPINVQDASTREAVFIKPSNLFPFAIEDNGVISWSLVSDDHSAWQEYIDEDDIFSVVEKGEPKPENAVWKTKNHKRKVKNVVWVNSVSLETGGVIFNNAFTLTTELKNPGADYTVTTPYPYDLGALWEAEETSGYNTLYNPFPTGTVYTNLTENRGKYWDYGNGWSRFLAFTWVLYRGDTITQPLYIIKGEDKRNPEIADPLGKMIKSTNVAPYSFTDKDDDLQWHSVLLDGGVYWRHSVCRLHRYEKGQAEKIRKNKEWPIFTNNIEGENANGWIMQLPFTARTENEGIYSLWFQGNKIAYATKYSTLSTPGGDELDRNLWISVEKEGTDGALKTNTINVIDGYFLYQIVNVINETDDATLMAKYFNIDKISDFLYRLNILDERNLIKELPSGSFDFIPAFLSWSMDSKLAIKDYALTLPPDGSDTSDIFFYANGVNQEKNDNDPVTSFLLPPIQLSLYVNKDNNEINYFDKMLIDNKNPIIVPNFTNTRLKYDTDFVDVYYSHTLVPPKVKRGSAIIYQYTLYMKDGLKYFDDFKQDWSWDVTFDEMLFPIGIGSVVKSENFITPTVQLPNDYSVRLFNKDNQTFLSFNIAVRTYRGQAIFTIYGGNYTYDGQGIYYIGSGNDYSQSQFVCYALGLKFLANSGSEAYFYSPWEKRLFLFTGSNTLQAAESYSSLGEVKSSLFSSNEQALYLLFDKLDDNSKDVLLIRTPDDTGTLDVDVGGHLESSASGCIIVNNGNGLSEVKSLAISPYVGTPLPFKLETEYIGDNSMIYKVSYIDILLLDNNKDVNFDVTFDIINGINTSKETKHIVLNKKDWKGSTYRYTFTPSNMMGNSFKLGIQSDKEIYITYIGVGLDDMSSNPVAPRTKGK